MNASRFRDRTHAGDLLAQEIERRYASRPVLAALGAGGTMVAARVAARLRLPLGVVHARKLLTGTPGVPFGAVDEDGLAVLDYPLIAGLRLSAADVERAKAEALAAIRPEVERHGGTPLRTLLPAPLAVIVTDGLATGLTMDAAVDHARRHGARKVVVATPCASARAAVRFLQHADGFVSLAVDESFAGIPACYDAFLPVPDTEVRRLLEAAAPSVERPA